jgi:hypothetical protein
MITQDPTIARATQKRVTHFAYDPLNDVVIATPHWRIECLADVFKWREQYEDFMKPFCRKMDLVVLLGDFELATKTSVAWGEARARVHREYTRFSVRVHPTEPVKAFVHTSSVRYGLSADQASTLQDAIRMIKKLRENAISETAKRSGRRAPELEVNATHLPSPRIG